MRTFAEKQNQSQNRVPFSLVLPNPATSELSHPSLPFLRLQHTIGKPALERLLQANSEDLETGSHLTAANRFGHDFSRVPPYPAIQRKCAACESGRGLCPGCAEEEERAQRMLMTTDMIPAIQRGIGEEEPVPMKDEPKKLPGEKKEGKKEEPAPKCPTETVTMSDAQCDKTYGARAKYCYSDAAGWWFKESVKNAPGRMCQPGHIGQTTNPIQSSTGCVTDKIFDLNGPPSKVAPCTDKTLQTVFAGPTKATVEQCKYSHEQLIDVTVTKNDAKSSPTEGKVITSSAGESTDCDWTA
jgi:hypothetical protein